MCSRLTDGSLLLDLFIPTVNCCYDVSQLVNNGLEVLVLQLSFLCKALTLLLELIHT